jgi:hypothetical protein
MSGLSAGGRLGWARCLTAGLVARQQVRQDLLSFLFLFFNFMFYHLQSLITRIVIIEGVVKTFHQENHQLPYLRKRR